MPGFGLDRVAFFRLSYDLCQGNKKIPREINPREVFNVNFEAKSVESR